MFNIKCFIISIYFFGICQSGIGMSIDGKVQTLSIAISKYMNNIEISVNNTLNYAMYMNFVSN